MQTMSMCVCGFTNYKAAWVYIGWAVASALGWSTNQLTDWPSWSLAEASAIRSAPIPYQVTRAIV